MIQVPYLIGYRCTISTVLEKQFNNFDVSVSFDLSLAQSRRVMKRGFASLKMQALFTFFLPTYGRLAATPREQCERRGKKRLVFLQRLIFTKMIGGQVFNKNKRKRLQEKLILWRWNRRQFPVWGTNISSTSNTTTKGIVFTILVEKLCYLNLARGEFEASSQPVPFRLPTHRCPKINETRADKN